MITTSNNINQYPIAKLAPIYNTMIFKHIIKTHTESCKLFRHHVDYAGLVEVKKFDLYSDRALIPT
jgi:hypothetical protein